MPQYERALITALYMQRYGHARTNITCRPGSAATISKMVNHVSQRSRDASLLTSESRASRLYNSYYGPWFISTGAHLDQSVSWRSAQLQCSGAAELKKPPLQLFVCMYYVFIPSVAVANSLGCISSRLRSVCQRWHRPL